jgi:Reverse transcriptase (RNA-dependent DNA polymerase)
MPSPLLIQGSAPTPPLRRRNPDRTLKHKGVTRLVPHLDSRQTYNSMMAMMSTSQDSVPTVSSISAFLLAENNAGLDYSTGLQEFLHPWTLQSPMVMMGKAKDPDTPSTREALSGPHAEQFWRAMDSEMECLEKKGSWEIVDRTTIPLGLKAIPGTWAHRIKRLPCGTLNKFKSRWCCRGDLMTLEGPTYSPLVGWPTVRAAMLLSATHGWKSRQVDFCNAFLQSDQPVDQPLYMELPQYYRPAELGDRDVVLRMKKSIYGQTNSPKLFYDHLCVGMQQLGFEPTTSDPCLFIHKEHKIMVLNYCDDQIWLSPDNSLIEEYVAKLQNLNYELILEEEGDLFAFLGISFKKDGSTIELTQPGLISKVITYLDMDNASPKDTPATTAPLGTDKDGDPFDEQWSYPAAIGMLLYISSNTRPDCQFAVHQAARFSHCPRKSHAQAVKRIVRYLLKTKAKGIEFVPNLEEGLNCYVDADFAGLHGYEDNQDPVSVKSRTGYTLTLFGCPIIWSSKLQTDITLSSTAAEYVAFSMAMREVLPMRALLKEVTSKLDLTCSPTTFVRSTVFEDNQGCLSLVNVPKMSTQNKYLALKYHFFRSSIGSEILAKYIPTTEQKADILTKGLASGPFETIRKLLLGW